MSHSTQHWSFRRRSSQPISWCGIEESKPNTIKANNTRTRKAHKVLKLNKCTKNRPKLECGPMPKVMAAQPNVGGALCKSSIIPFLVPRRKVWLTDAAGVPSSNSASIRERKTWTQSEFCTWQIPSGGQSPQKCIYNVPAHETAKHCAKFAWPPVNDVAAVTKPRRETH